MTTSALHDNIKEYPAIAAVILAFNELKAGASEKDNGTLVQDDHMESLERCVRDMFTSYLAPI